MSNNRKSVQTMKESRQ